MAARLIGVDGGTVHAGSAVMLPSNSRPIARPPWRLGARAIATMLACASPLHAAPSDLQLVELATELPRPVDVREAPDGSGRLFVVGQLGTVSIFVDGAVGSTPFLDLSGVSELPTPALPETGLLGLAFDPDFAENGYLYLAFTIGPDDRRSRIARFEVMSDDPDRADPASAVTVFELVQPFGNHNGGNLAFGPDGYLYVGVGDGGSIRDADGHGQDPSVLFGKMLRLDVDLVATLRGPAPVAVPGPGGHVANYGIPPDNPFVDDPSVRDEIWALGLRNPWRYSFDRIRGDLWIGDVGALDREEIDFEPAGQGGRNYGWACREGTLEQGFDDCLPGPLEDPVLDYGRDGGCAVTGGFRYRGHHIAGFDGTYVYGDYCTGRVWLATVSDAGTLIANELWQNTPFSISSFGEDRGGELYLLALGDLEVPSGALYRFESPSTVFVDGFEGGTVSGWSATSPP